MAVFCADTVGRRTSSLSSSTYPRCRARTYASKASKEVTPVGYLAVKRGALLAIVVLAACTVSSVDPRATAPPTGQSPIALFDAHVHYSADARQRFTIDEVLAILSEAGVRRALVSSTPDDGTIALYERAPEIVIPILRPYRGPGEIGTWTRDGTVVAYLNSRFRPGVHRGIG